MYLLKKQGKVRILSKQVALVTWGALINYLPLSCQMSPDYVYLLGHSHKLHYICIFSNVGEGPFKDTDIV